MTIAQSFTNTGIADTEMGQIAEFWADVLAPKFIRFRHVLEGGLSRHSDAVLPHLQFPQGGRVMDLGCGFGDTAAIIARQVGSAGQVLGVDCCETFLQIARNRPEKMFLPNLSFACRDAERDLGSADYDMVFSRFGTMFFANPVMGLRTIRRALKPGGRFAHIVWRQRADNPWLSEANEIVRRFLPAPDATAATCGPGPFSMADQEMVTGQMTAAGFRDIAFRRVDAKVLVGNSVADAVAFQLAIGPAGETFRTAGALAEERRGEIEAALAKMFSTVEATSQGLWMDSSSWLITASNPTD